MRYRGAEQGISFVGLMFVLVILGCSLLIGLKLFPIYLESFKIDKAMKGLISDSKIGERSRREIQAALIKRFDINSVKAIRTANAKEHIAISSQNGNVSIDVEYEEVTELIGNVSLLITFSKHVEN